jgi:curli biogenesis system outer membrane secretion channel CsgG
MPASAAVASYIRVVDTTTGTVLSLVNAAGVTRNLTAGAGDEFWVEYMATGAATTCDCVQFGWV